MKLKEIYKVLNTKELQKEIDSIKKIQNKCDHKVLYLDQISPEYVKEVFNYCPKCGLKVKK